MQSESTSVQYMQYGSHGVVPTEVHCAGHKGGWMFRAGRRPGCVLFGQWRNRQRNMAPWWWLFVGGCLEVCPKTIFRNNNHQKITNIMLIQCWRVSVIKDLSRPAFGFYAFAEDTEHRLRIFSQVLDRAYASEFWDRNVETLKIFLAPEWAGCFDFFDGWAKVCGWVCGQLMILESVYWNV